jgi:hypothetical protein
MLSRIHFQGRCSVNSGEHNIVTYKYKQILRAFKDSWNDIIMNSREENSFVKEHFLKPAAFQGPIRLTRKTGLQICRGQPHTAHDYSTSNCRLISYTDPCSSDHISSIPIHFHRYVLTISNFTVNISRHKYPWPYNTYSNPSANVRMRCVQTGLM